MAAVSTTLREVIVPMDGDLQNDPADIRLLLDQLDEGYDVVSGWRKNRRSTRDRASVPARQPPDRPGHRCAPARLRLHAEGLSRDVVEAGLYGEMHRFIPATRAVLGRPHHRGQVVGTIRGAERKSKYGLVRTLKVLLDLSR